MSKRLIAKAVTVNEAREKLKAMHILFDEDFTVKIAGQWMDASGVVQFGVPIDTMDVVSIGVKYVTLDDRTECGELKLQPDPDASSWRTPEIYFYAEV